MRVRIATILVFALMLLSISLPPAALGAVIRGVVVQSGLVHPWDIAFAPTGQMIVTERGGKVKVFASSDPNASLLATSTIGQTRAEGESGLMGIEIDHLFSKNRLIYVCVSRMDSGQWLNQVIRYKVASNWQLVFDRYLIRWGMRANTIHNGCAVEEGPDFQIWVTMGDSGNSALAQNPMSLNGKVLRVGRDGAEPADNPILPGASQRTFAFSMGHRNPQGITFQPGSNRAYVIEHGPERSDEINWILKGRNYGWPCRVGTTAYQSCSNSGPFQNPVWNSGSSTIATSNGTFVVGSPWLDFQNQLFVATLKEQDLRRFTVESDGSPAVYRQTYFNNLWGRLRATVPGPRYLLYLTTSNGLNDKVIRVIPSST
jgi:glucose/arabinose dehydrogenase